MRSRWQRVRRTHRSRISRIPSLALVHEIATSKSRSGSRLLLPYWRGVHEGHDEEEEIEIEGYIVVEVEDGGERRR